MAQSEHERLNPLAAPDLDDIATRPSSPAIVRFIGCDAEMAGLNSDYFTVGRGADCDLQLPDALGGDPTIVLRFSRGAEGWRVSPSNHLPVFINQDQVTGLTPLESGDVLRFAPGGPGLQFAVVPQNAPPLGQLAARFAPRLMGGKRSGGNAGAARTDASPEAGEPLRYAPAAADASDSAAKAGGGRGAALDVKSWGVSPTVWLVVVAGAIVLGVALGVWLTSSLTGGVPAQGPAPARQPNGASDGSPAEGL